MCIHFSPKLHLCLLLVDEVLVLARSGCFMKLDQCLVIGFAFIQIFKGPPRDLCVSLSNESSPFLCVSYFAGV